MDKVLDMGWKIYLPK